MHLAVALPEEQPDDPWYVVSDEPTDLHTFDEYGLRFDIEETFLDEKSGGFQLEGSELTTPDAVERLVLILAIATIHLTSIGLEVVQANVRRLVDTHGDRDLSYLKIGAGCDNATGEVGWCFVRFCLIRHQTPYQSFPHAKLRLLRSVSGWFPFCVSWNATSTT